jgi:hypothetical protein
MRSEDRAAMTPSTSRPRISAVLLVQILIQLLALLTPAPSRADEAGHAEAPADGDREVARVVRAGEREELVGEFVSIDEATVSVRIKGTITTVALTDVAWVEVERHDSRTNGAIIGAAIVGVWCAFVCGQGLDSASRLPLAVVVNGAVGGLIGAMVDGGKRERSVIYRAPGTARLAPAGPRLVVSRTFRF